MTREEAPKEQPPDELGPSTPVEGEAVGPRQSFERWKRRLLGLQVGLMGATIVASILLYTVTGIESALERAGPLTRDMFAFVGILAPAGHAGLAFLLTTGSRNIGRYAVRGTWVMITVHLLWGGGIAVGHWPALPVGLVLVAGDLLFLSWLGKVRDSLDAGEKAPAEVS